MRHAAALLLLTAAGAARAGTPAGTIVVELDAREAGRGLLHARLTIPVSPGPLTLLYPQWLPGDHLPSGRIVDVTGIEMSAGGKPLAWRRDDDDMFAFHVEAPPGATALEVKLDFLEATSGEGEVSSTPELALLRWNNVVLYPKGSDLDAQQISASLRLPPGWKAGTALRAQRDAGAQITFAPVSVTTLVDSPVLAGAHTLLLPLKDRATVRLFAAGDSDTLLEPTPAASAGLRRLPFEAAALFGAEHFASYTFLLSVSDDVQHFGVEHHESSDIRVPERWLIDDAVRLANAELVAHELVHSWNGKFRRPAGLMPGRLDVPMRGELLWVYEGLTEYLGAVVAARSGMLSIDDYRDALAEVAAGMAQTTGRSWRTLADTTVGAQLLYTAPAYGEARRRGVDFYDEGQLLWLEVDVLIRTQSTGRASLDDFCRAFFGGPGGAPRVVPYGLDDVVLALDAVAPYDWRAFFQRRVYEKRTAAPVEGLEAAGWRLAWTDRPTPRLEAMDSTAEQSDLRFSLGVTVNDDGTLVDVTPGSPADAAGLPTSAKVIAVNGRKLTRERLHDAVRATPRTRSIELLVESGETVKSFTLRYARGERYPRLERLPSRTDWIGAILTPLTSHR